MKQFHEIKIKSDNLKEVKEKIISGLAIAIDQNKFVIFPQLLALVEKDFVYDIFLDSGLVEEEKRHVHVSDLSQLQMRWWEITFDPEKQFTYAHSNTRKPLHTDNAWFECPPEISLFAMETQVSSGGESTLLPLEELIDKLRTDNLDLFSKITNHYFEIKKGDELKGNYTKIIDVNKMEINWNYYRTITKNKYEENLKEDFYQYLEQLENKEKIYIKKFKTNDVYVFNDLKFLHARKGFNADTKGQRLLNHAQWRLIRK